MASSQVQSDKNLILCQFFFRISHVSGDRDAERMFLLYATERPRGADQGFMCQEIV